MTGSVFHTRLMAKLREESDRRAGDVLNGSPPDEASYRASVGYLQGLQAARTLADETEHELHGTTTNEG